MPKRVAELEKRVLALTRENGEIATTAWMIAEEKVRDYYKSRMSREVAGKLKAAIRADRMGGGVVKVRTAIKHVFAIIDQFTES